MDHTSSGTGRMLYDSPLSDGSTPALMANSLRLAMMVQFLITFKTNIYVGPFFRKALSLPFDFAVGVHFDHMSRWHKTDVGKLLRWPYLIWPGKTSERQSTPIGAGSTGKAWYDFFLPHHRPWKRFLFCHMETFATWKCQIYYTWCLIKLSIVTSLVLCAPLIMPETKHVFKSKVMKMAEKCEVEKLEMKQICHSLKTFVCPTRFHNSSQLGSTCHTASLAGAAFPFHQTVSAELEEKPSTHYLCKQGLTIGKF